MGFATNFSSFMVGRFCSSVGVGYAVMVAPLYIAEISPVSSSRGFLTSLPELLVNVGSLLGGIVSYCLPMISSQLGWRFMVGIAAFASVFLFIALLSITSESSYWLVMKDRLPDAKRVLEKTSGSFEESRLIFEEIKKAAGIPDQNGTTVCVGLKELLIHPSPAVRHMLITALAVHFFQQASGISVITSFTTNVFEKAGVQRESHQQFISYAIGLAGIMCNLVATALVDKIGRRVLLLSSLAGMAFSLMGFAIGLTIIHHHSHHSDQKITWALTICIICSLFCTVFFSIGIGPIAWIYSSEIFPPRLRALGSGMAAAMNFFTTAIVVFSFAVLIRFKTSFNFGSLFFLYTGIALSGWIFIYLFLPETKGNSLQEMEKLFLGLGPFSGNRIRNSIHHWNII
ncbi:OLC1v1036945C1 [Oldenlandia corymbosa var. corymbosa]|nr:OLC1v1036945C1 [Oldenlandia corymbosa var. corymbosa]